MKHHLLFIIFIIAFSCNQRNDQQKQDSIGTFSKDSVGDKMYTTDSEDAGMNEAIDLSRSTLDVFEKALKSGNKDYEYFALKKRFVHEQSGEHIWINEIKISGDGYSGIVNNDPVMVTEIKYGDTVYISKQDITDWMFLDKNIMRGGYTMRLELKRMAPEEKAALLRNLDYKIEE